MSLKLGYGYVLVDGVRINYYRTGDDKPAIILLHGTMDNGLCWNQLPLMLEPIFDVVMIDARGHGFSDAPQNDYATSDYSNDVLAVITALNLKEPILIGHSMGANTATLLAARRPGLIKCLVLEDPPWHVRQASITQEERVPFLEEQRNRINNLKALTFDNLIELCHERHPTWNESEYFQWAKAKQEVSPNIVVGLMDDQFSWQKEICYIKSPGLLITGNNNLGGIITRRGINQARNLWKNLTVVEVQDAGHNIRREQFTLYWKAVSSFLKAHTSK